MMLRHNFFRFGVKHTSAENIQDTPKCTCMYTCVFEKSEHVVHSYVGKQLLAHEISIMNGDVCDSIMEDLCKHNREEPKVKLLLLHSSCQLFR